MARWRRRREQDDPHAEAIALLELTLDGAAWAYKLPAWVYQLGLPSMAKSSEAACQPLLPALRSAPADLTTRRPYHVLCMLKVVGDATRRTPSRRHGWNGW